MVVQQGRREFGARSVQAVREHDKFPRNAAGGHFEPPVLGFRL